MSWQPVVVGDFLKNRDERFKPDDKKVKSIRRIDKIDFSGQLFLSNKPSNTDMILVKKNDLVISGINVEKGAMCIYCDEEDISATIHYSSYEINKNKIDIDFLKLFLISHEFKYALKEQVPGGIKTEIKPKHLLPLKIVIPKTLDEQSKIVEEYTTSKDKMLKLSSEFENQLELISKLRQQVLQDAIQGKLVPQDTNDEPASILLEKIKAEKEKLIKEKKLKKGKPLPPIKEEDIPFDIPDNWIWCSLGEVCDYITKGSSPRWQGVQYVDDEDKGILFVTSKNIGSYKLDLSNLTYVEKKFNEIEPKSILKKGDLLTNLVGASIGRTALYDLDSIANINQAVCILRILHNFINKSYLLHLMNSTFVIDLMFKYQFAPGRANLSMINVSKFPIPFPPLKEQVRIVKNIDELLKVCYELEKEVSQNQNLTHQLLQSALKEALEPNGY